MSNYTQQKFRLETVWVQTGGRPLAPALQLSYLRVIVPMLLGERRSGRPGQMCCEGGAQNYMTMTRGALPLYTSIFFYSALS